MNAQFSTSRDILTRFITDNEAQLFALTARDAVAGELNNSVFRADSPADLFNIRKITVEADTTAAHLKDAAKLHKKIETFMNEEDAWWDDVLIADMIELSSRTGDVTKHPIMFSRTEYEQKNFFTELFGGLYIFRDARIPAVIARGSRQKLGKLPVSQVLDFDDRGEIIRFLDENNLVESIITASGLDAAALLNQRLDFILIDTAAEAGEEVAGLTRSELRHLHRRHMPNLPEEYHVLSDVWRWVTQGGEKPRIGADNPAAFYTLRAAPGPDRDLVNMLLAELCPHDIRQLYIVHKQAFLDAYQTWPESKRDYVADYLAREYVIDKEGAREALFGGEEPMLTEVSGPWGSYKR